MSQQTNTVEQFIALASDSIVTRNYNGRDWHFIGQNTIDANDVRTRNIFDTVYNQTEQAIKRRNEYRLAKGWKSTNLMPTVINGTNHMFGISYNAELSGQGRTLMFSEEVVRETVPQADTTVLV